MSSIGIVTRGFIDIPSIQQRIYRATYPIRGIMVLKKFELVGKMEIKKVLKGRIKVIAPLRGAIKTKKLKGSVVSLIQLKGRIR